MSLDPAPNGYPIKLVRDNTPRIINSSGKPGDLFYREIPDDSDRLKWLKKKLMEEVAEYLIDGGIDELTQVMQVVLSIAHWHGLDPLSFADISQRDDRGLFFHGVMMYGLHREFDK